MQGRLLCGTQICVQNLSNVPAGTLAQLLGRHLQLAIGKQLEYSVGTFRSDLAGPLGGGPCARLERQAHALGVPTGILVQCPLEHLEHIAEMFQSERMLTMFQPEH